MTASDRIDTVPLSPRATATALATTARTTDITRVRALAASTFWPRTVSGRVERRKVPAWMVVLMRLPKVPKMFPRRPMAAGTRTSRPGRRAKVAVIEPSMAPATRLVLLFSPSATRLWRAASGSGPRRPRRRAPRWGRRRSMVVEDVLARRVPGSPPAPGAVRGGASNGRAAGRCGGDPERSEPAALLERAVEEEADHRHEPEGEGVAECPVELRQVLEVHAVD